MTERDPGRLRAVLRQRHRGRDRAGRAQMADAVSEYLVRKSGEVHELLITHNFVIAWFVREVLQAPGVAMDDAQPGALRPDGHRAEAGAAVDAARRTTTSAHLPGRAAHRPARGLSGLIRRGASRTSEWHSGCRCTGSIAAKPDAAYSARRPPECDGCRAPAPPRRTPAPVVRDHPAAGDPILVRGSRDADTGA